MKSEFAAYSDSEAVTVFTPSLAASVGSADLGFRASAEYLVDVVSAASVDIVSSASPSWIEVRHAGTLDLARRWSSVGADVAVAASLEPDYESLTGGGRLFLELSDKTLNPLFAYSFGQDKAGRSGTPFSSYSQVLRRHALTAAVELVLNRATTFTFTVDGVFERGDQKKPYRMLPMFAPGEAARVPPGASLSLVNQLRLPGRMTERTPLGRNRFAVSGRLATRFTRATLILDQRLYADDWGLLASTSDTRLGNDVGRRFFVWLHARGHLQTGVRFWQRAYVASIADSGVSSVPEYRTGDRELSPFVSLTVGPGARWRLGELGRSEGWSLSVQGDFTHTAYRDAVYVSKRQAALALAALELGF